MDVSHVAQVDLNSLKMEINPWLGLLEFTEFMISSLKQDNMGKWQFSMVGY